MRLFGTDGVRGIAGTELGVELAMKLGVAAAKVLGGHSENRVAIIGRDTRISGQMLEQAIAVGLMSEGYKIISLGVVPTPAVAMLVKLEKASLGVMISASHNPYEFNGIKFFGADGYKLSDEVEDRIESAVKSEMTFGDHVGYVQSGEHLVERYIEILKNVAFGEKTGLEGLNISVDAANGSLFSIAPRVLTDLGAQVSVIGNNPDGQNINRNVGSTHMNACQNYTMHNRSDIGLSFDGDGDRLLVCDELGKIYDGDAIMLALALDLKEKGHLRDDVLVATVMSNLGLERACKHHGIDLLRTKVGDRYISEELVRHDYSIGGEQSGHIILSKFATTGDGLLTAVYLLALLKKSGKRASEFLNNYMKLPQVTVSVNVPNERKYTLLQDAIIAAQIEKLEEKYSGSGRVLIRPSGTEPLVRIMIEGENQEALERDALVLSGFIEGRLSSL
ncbi:MAG: phosphoglucosamine mutase [Bacillota bacterium]|nr:phosphoglucosamine mutase [Bacillota bacterium]